MILNEEQHGGHITYYIAACPIHRAITDYNSVNSIQPILGLDWYKTASYGPAIYIILYVPLVKMFGTAVFA